MRDSVPSILLNLQYVKLPAHLAKRLSDLKQNGTQEKTPFSGIVFHTLSQTIE